MILTDRQREVYDLIKRYKETTGEPIMASRIIRELEIKSTSAYDRIHSLERKNMIRADIMAGRTVYYPLPEPPDEPPKRKQYIYVDHGIAEPNKSGIKRNPITWDEVERAKQKIVYRGDGRKGTPLKLLKRYDPDDETGTMIRVLETVEPVKAYPHGVLCEGRRLRRFIRWIDVAMYFRNPKRAIGEGYGREKLK